MGRLQLVSMNGLPREAVESLSMKVLRKCVDVALRHMVSGHGGRKGDCWTG